MFKSGNYLPDILPLHNETKLCKTMKKSQTFRVRLESLFISTVILLLIKPTYPATHDGATDLIAATRCRARCLANLDIYLRQLDSSGIQNYEPDKANVLKTCFMDRTCSACSRPCDLISRLDEVDCSEWCQEDEDECLSTCSFLEEIGSKPSNPGNCPAPGATSSAVCINACESDRDCDADTQGLKCCSNGCGTSCQRPVSIDYLSYPPKPHQIKVAGKKKKGSRSAAVKWSVKRAIDFANNPTVYIVQYKHHPGRLFNKHAMPKEWDNTVLVVNGREVTVREMEVGHWYVFRVASVDARGSAGFVESPVPFRLQAEPMAPSPPYNLTAIESTIRDGRHFVKIRWDAPRETDLPISKYKIFWNKQTQGLQKVVTRKNKDGKKTISGKTFEFILKNLEGSTVYLVQVQAVIQYGQRKLRSKKTHVVISTHGDNNVASPQRLVDEPSADGDRQTPAAGLKYDAAGERLLDAVLDLDLDSPMPAHIQNLTAGSPYFQNGLVKVDVSWNKPDDNGATMQIMMHWVPDVCIGGNLNSLMTKPVTATTDGNRFTVFDLRFDCRYIIQVQGVSSSGKRGPISPVSVNVLGCKDTLVIGRITPQCGLDSGTLSTHLPQRPESLAHVYRVSRKEVKVSLSWDYPKSWPVSTLSGWRIVWGKRRRNTSKGAFSSAGSHSILDKSTAVSSMLPANVTSFVIRHLAEGSNYVFQVRAIAPQGAGRLAEILLTTPLRPDPPRRKKSKPTQNDKIEAKWTQTAESWTASSAARADKPAAATSSDVTTSNYSILNNLDPERLKRVGARKSEPPSEGGGGGGGGKRSSSPASSSMGAVVSFAILVMPLFVADLVR